jgi:hypothetical protein
MRREKLTHQWHPRLAGTPRPTVDDIRNWQTMAPQRNSPRRTRPHGKSFHQRVLGSFGLDANHQNGKLGQRLVGVALFLQDFVELEDFLRLLDDSFSADRDFRVEIFLPHHDSPVSFVSVTMLASALCSASLTRQNPGAVHWRGLLAWNGLRNLCHMPKHRAGTCLSPHLSWQQSLETAAKILILIRF